MMGIAAGGLISQKLYADPRSRRWYDTERASRCFVHVVNSRDWQAVTGRPMPRTPVSAQSYTDAGLPWFQLYDEAKCQVAPCKALASVQSISAIDAANGQLALEPDERSLAADSIVDAG